jgi:hypothetical protein
MKKLAVFLVLFGLLPQISHLNASRIIGGNANLKVNGKSLLELIGDRKQDLAERFSSHLIDLKEKNGSNSPGRPKLDCLPDWLKPNGANGQGGREKLDFSSIWKHKIDLKNLCDKRPDFNKWCEKRKPCVPEPSSALAGLLALSLGFVGWKRMRPMN